MSKPFNVGLTADFASGEVRLFDNASLEELRKAGIEHAPGPDAADDVIGDAAEEAGPVLVALVRPAAAVREVIGVERRCALGPGLAGEHQRERGGEYSPAPLDLERLHRRTPS